MYAINRTSTVTLSTSSGETLETFEVPVTSGSETVLTVCIEQIESDIANLWHARRGTTVGNMDARLNSIIGAIRMVTIITGLTPQNDQQIVRYLRGAAFRAHRAALDRRAGAKFTV